MTTRNEIIAQIDDELIRLERARDFLAAALTGSPNGSKIASTLKAKTRVPAQKRKQQPATTAVPATNGLQGRATVVAAPPPPPREEPQVKRVPPKRRMERRHLQTEKSGKSGAALSGSVPSGPIAVSADEARKVQERTVQPTPATPIASELRSDIGAERSLGSLIQAFERRAGLSGLETP
jgi:hypothetical protein